MVFLELMFNSFIILLPLASPAMSEITVTQDYEQSPPPDKLYITFDDFPSLFILLGWWVAHLHVHATRFQFFKHLANSFLSCLFSFLRVQSSQYNHSADMVDVVSTLPSDYSLLEPVLYSLALDIQCASYFLFLKEFLQITGITCHCWRRWAPAPRVAINAG